MPPSPTRRDFLKNTTVLAAGLAVAGNAAAQAARGPNDKALRHD